MHLTKVKKPLNKDDILRKISSYDVYRYYLGPFIVGELMQNPCTKRQSTPSFGVYLKDGELYHNDFAVPEIHGDCVALVQQLNGYLPYPDAIEKIVQDMHLISGGYTNIVNKYYKPVLDEKRYTFIQVSAKEWEEKELLYWQQYGISLEQLQREKIYPVKEWYLNRKKQYIGEDELCFAYRYKEGFKIYYPFRTGKDKWRTNIGKVVENEQCIDKCSKIIISKSKKDRCVLTNVLPAEIGVINVQSESPSSYTDKLVDMLKNKEVYLSFDSDEPGKKASMAINRKFPQWLHVNVPDYFYVNMGITDWADLYSEYGKEPILHHFRKKGIIK